MTHFEFMESQRQLTIFDCMSENQPWQVGDKVKCIVTAEKNLEAYYLLKYYHPEALRDIGEVVMVEGKAVTVRFRLEYVLLSAEYLEHQ